MNREANKYSTSQQEDELLIKNFLADDMRAFDRLVIKYKDTVFNLCFKILNDYDDADDCSQETFMKVYGNLRSFRFQSSFLTWLYRIAVNTCRNRLSSAQSRMSRTSVRIGNPADGDSDPVDIGDRSYDPGIILEKNEQKQQIHEAIELLPHDLKVLIILRDLEGKTYEDISEITRVTIGTVKSRLARARNQLRDKLRGVL
jgi:RNA polymerase sigma-70 factor (ECF subfamily)